jgi:hypothetical protein
MLAWMIAGLIVSILAYVGLVLGLRLAHLMREQFDELLPQRMIDYAGYVDVSTTRD